ncbi:MAG TPA: DUF2330 domain-containing protein [Bacteroidia bacterium]|nr:DUF2330 domain-containing protein [Bacteroidia bacterium]HQF27989.1 DUF2330 domain-containing protein [Bacteroidia bacterium]HQK96394.1 DUF2330 domain-containing protein [Bacteroidia bacterium]
MKNYRKITSAIFVMALTLVSISAYSFCGFYVSQQSKPIFNKTSQVILVRDGNRNVITMSSDFKGDVKDFAMVVPVPVVLQKSDIKVVNRQMFDDFDAYSAPRLVEYYDPSPCNSIREEVMDKVQASMSYSKDEEIFDQDKKNAKYKVTVEAKYTVGEYDILILSAKESGGLKHWLTDNGYKIPEGAEEVLQPYIQSNMKFFVVKVNIEEQKANGTEILRPLQIAFNSPKFMLPIRLGMANGKGSQDLIVYTLTKNGRVETTNYRTVKMPTDREVPEFVQQYFGKFYVDLYKKNLAKEGSDNVFMEYGWDISGQMQVKCDPCAGNPPMLNGLFEAGVNWISPTSWGGYNGSVYFTRLHVTYNREDFPQDLVFQETPDRSNFQCRYIINHPAQQYGECPEWSNYRDRKKASRRKELKELSALTGWNTERYWEYPSKFMGYSAPLPPDEETGYITPKEGKTNITASPEIDQTTTGSIEEDISNSRINQTAFINTRTPEHKKPIDWGLGFGMIAIVTLASLARMQKKG